MVRNGSSKPLGSNLNAVDGAVSRFIRNMK
jgi:hypothetical protein